MRYVGLCCCDAWLVTEVCVMPVSVHSDHVAIESCSGRFKPGGLLKSGLRLGLQKIMPCKKSRPDDRRRDLSSIPSITSSFHPSTRDRRPQGVHTTAQTDTATQTIVTSNVTCKYQGLGTALAHCQQSGTLSAKGAGYPGGLNFLVYGRCQPDQSIQHVLTRTKNTP